MQTFNQAQWTFLCHLSLSWYLAAGGSNYSVPVPGASGAALSADNPLAAFEDELSRTIVDLEVNADQWTLMHRYNKAAELIDQALQVRIGPALTFSNRDNL